MASILSSFSFEGSQEQAATDPSHAIGVTAGAGSGKTRTLVGRYLHLLERGYPLRSLIAITFTDKAAREMRTRIRGEIGAWLEGESGFSHNLHPPLGETPEAQDWETVFAELDSARIGTIHSLCAEILRAHPAEADVDPNFAVLEEGLAATLKSQAVETALAWAATQPEIVTLFGPFTENQLRQILAGLLNRRLDLASLPGISAPQGTWGDALADWLDECLDLPAWTGAIEALESLQAHAVDDVLESARRQLLTCWQEFQEARASQNWDAAFSALVAVRQAISTQGRKDNWDAADLETAREAMRTLRGFYEDHLAPLVGKGPSVRWALDEQVAALLPAAYALIDKAIYEYQRLKQDRQALDFDDLEGLAASLLLERAEVRARWQSETRAVLVDEFQDTNQRQRQIVYALTGFDPTKPGAQRAELFIVGDAKQSIYKFRGADVTVFRQVQADIARAGGLPLDLNLTFRAHKTLLDGLNALLPSILGQSDDPARPYQVPFAPLEAYRQSAVREIIHPPYIEFHIGLGDDAESGRQAAASALAQRLHKLSQVEGFDWGQMALLFRSSTGFEYYENALEAAGIPFITIAGRGFYNRPEIRDLLNALVAIADPSDDLALAGLLRSPAIGLSDADLYYLRFPGRNGEARPIWESLAAAAAQDAAHARAYQVIHDLHTLAGRALAAEVLKGLLDLTGYRAILSTLSEGSRMQRNVDKLLADAHRSRLVSLGEFLEYVQALRDVGLREGEAPVEAGGAVQLMTVHKAKGLEFPLVVIADAAYQYHGGAGSLLLDDRFGLLLCLKDDQARPVAWQLASLEDAAREQAEDKRLLYVAATRAREKLIVSGHAKATKSGQLSLRGWLRDLGQVIQLDQVQLDGELAAPRRLDVAVPEEAGPLDCILHPFAAPTPPKVSMSATVPQPVQAEALPDLVAPLEPPDQEVADEKIRQRESDPPQRVWRVVSQAKRPTGPAWVVGKLVHEALRHWRFPDAGFDTFIQPFALEAGLTDPTEIRATIQEVRRLLQRFRAHPLYAEIESAECYHEVPYISPGDRGVIDLLYRNAAGWCLVDFKTDRVRTEDEAHRTIEQEGYDQQVQRYAEAATAQLGQRPKTLILFLHVGGKVIVF